MQNTDTPQKILALIKDPAAQIGDQYRGVFQLKSLSTQESVQALLESFRYMDDSELLMHEITYALGQLSAEFQEIIFPFLIKVVQDEKEFPVVRHQAGEALSNFACHEHRQLFEKYSQSEVSQLKNTCLLALKKLDSFDDLKERYGTKYYGTREPAAPYSQQELKALFVHFGLQKEEKSIEDKIETLLMKTQVELFQKYRLLYYLRDHGNEQVYLIFSQILAQSNWNLTNNLLRHEVCFILGQVADKATICLPQIKATILDQQENEIVRHEAISAYSSMTEEMAFLEPLIEDKSRIVKESAIVALDMIDYWKK